MKPDDQPVAYLTHEEANLLLPWYVNGTLDSAAAVQLRTHLSGCVVCRREQAMQEKLHFAIRTSDIKLHVPQRSFAKLRGQIEAQPVAAIVGRRTVAQILRERWEAVLTFPTLRLGGYVAAGALAGFLALSLPGGSGRIDDGSDVKHVYHTLAQHPSAGVQATVAGTIHVAFRAGTTQRDIKALFDKVHAAVVAGPDARGVFTVRSDAGDTSPNSDILELLRVQPQVLLAEPALPGT
jgi:hypothetical protein